MQSGAAKRRDQQVNEKNRKSNTAIREALLRTIASVAEERDEYRRLYEAKVAETIVLEEHTRECEATLFFVSDEVSKIYWKLKRNEAQANTKTG